MKYILFTLLLIWGCEKADPLQKEAHVVTFELTDKYPLTYKSVLIACGTDTVRTYLSDTLNVSFDIADDTYVSCYIKADSYFHSQITVKIDGKKVFHKEGTCVHRFYGFENYLVNI